jgi:hypothetical protein
MDKAAGKQGNMSSPALQVWEKLGNVAGDVRSTVGHKKTKQYLLIDTVDAVGTFGGFPGTGQITKSWKYLSHVNSGKEHPKSTRELIRNTVFGPPPKKEQ